MAKVEQASCGDIKSAASTSQMAQASVQCVENVISIADCSNEGDTMWSGCFSKQKWQ